MSKYTLRFGVFAAHGEGTYTEALAHLKSLKELWMMNSIHHGGGVRDMKKHLVVFSHYDEDDDHRQIEVFYAYPSDKDMFCFICGERAAAPPKLTMSNNKLSMPFNPLKPLEEKGFLLIPLELI